jgi:hypothetical protein
VTLVGGTDFQLRGESNLATAFIIHTESSPAQIHGFWCRGQDLNLHALRHWILSRVSAKNGVLGINELLETNTVSWHGRDPSSSV